MAFRLVRAENVWKSPGDSLRRSKIEAKVMPREKKRRWNCCVGWGEMVEARPGRILVQHHGAAGLRNLSIMINSSEV